MDPNKALENILSLAEQLANDDSAPDKAIELAEYVLGLDEWLNRAGFLPARWDHPRTASAPKTIRHRGQLYRKID